MIVRLNIPVKNSSPIIILSSSQRSGSTLLPRLLFSADNSMRESFIEERNDQFIASMIPEKSIFLDDLKER
ncbi:MAG: hypothetical protein ACI9FG_001282 [Crocinitomicaceae bacterium]